MSAFYRSTMSAQSILRRQRMGALHFLVIIGLCLTSLSSYANVPPIPTAVSPKGAITDSTPTYVFSEETGIVSYQVQIQLGDGRRVHKWFRPHHANCQRGSCSVTMPHTISGAAHWRVRTQTSSARGNFTRFNRFIVSSGDQRPTRLELNSPFEDQTGSSVTYNWSATSGARRYQLSIVDSNNRSYKQWYTASEADCAANTATSCSVSRADNLPVGKIKWLARVQTSSGFSPWSRPMRFDYLRSGSQTPAITEIDTPAASEAVRSRAVAYRWRPVTDATQYQLRITDSKNQTTTQSYPVSSLGCNPTCTLIRKESLPAGQTKFSLRAFSPNGGLSPWSATRSYSMEYRRLLKVGVAVKGSVEKDATHEFTLARGLWVNLISRSGDADLTVTRDNSVVCASSRSTEDNCVFSSLTSGIIKITGIGSGTSDYIINYQEHHPDCFKQPTLFDLTYLSAKFRTTTGKRALTRVSSNVCADTTYYKYVDPQNRRSTLDGWLRTNGFLKPRTRKVVDKINTTDLVSDVYNAEYHNMIDLGFGRDMYCKRHGATPYTYPCVVQNYLISPNLAIASRSPASFQVSVTMEFRTSCRASSFARNCGPTAFYVYDNKGRRISNVDLDGRGRKNVPQVCHSCHNGDFQTFTISGRGTFSTLTGGDYLPFDEKLFGHFDRDQRTNYSPHSSLGVANQDTRSMNRLLKPVLKTNVRSDGTLREGSLGYFTSTDYIVAHRADSFQAKTRGAFCAVCHVAVKGTYALTTSDANGPRTNCKLCHDSAAGGGSLNLLASQLCAGQTATHRMPNARTTHRAMYYAWFGSPPYSTLRDTTRQFVSAVCGASGRPATPR